MRLLIALQYYLPHRTGYTLHVQRVAEAMVRRGHEVTVITARHLPSLADREVVAGVEVVRFATPIHVSRGMMMPGYPWQACPDHWLRRAFRAGEAPRSSPARRIEVAAAL